MHTLQERTVKIMHNIITGTEENNELCSHVPGPACSETSGNLQTVSGEGFIHVHRGIHGVGSLADDVFDWRSPVAEITISS